MVCYYLLNYVHGLSTSRVYASHFVVLNSDCIYGMQFVTDLMVGMGGEKGWV
jgi:hypothetical protein